MNKDVLLSLFLLFLSLFYSFLRHPHADGHYETPQLHDFELNDAPQIRTKIHDFGLRQWVRRHVLAGEWNFPAVMYDMLAGRVVCYHSLLP